MWYRLLRAYVWLGLHFYFKTIIIHGDRKIPQGPVIFAANHQNAFLDALLIVCFNAHRTHFLSRADIFKNSFIRRVLSFLNMVPIYRIRDGWQSLAENKKTFEACHHLFVRKEAIAIFPEGNHGAQRNLRPLKKGFAKVAFDSLHRTPDMKINIVPVGINYSDHQSFRSSVSIFFGEAILANKYYPGFQPSESNLLRNELAIRLKRITTHIEVENYESIIHQLESTHPNYLDPSETNSRIARIENKESLTTDPIAKSESSWLGKPFHYLALLFNLIPLMIWRNIRSRIKDPVLVGSIKFGVGIFLFPFYYLMMGIVFYWVAGPYMTLGWLIFAAFSTLFLKR